ncbi:hypothetical protein ACP70R_048255 [Stipagrostis hirtigluma subsp. patula]
MSPSLSSLSSSTDQHGSGGAAGSGERGNKRGFARGDEWGSGGILSSSGSSTTASDDDNGAARPRRRRGSGCDSPVVTAAAAAAPDLWTSKPAPIEEWRRLLLQPMEPQ